MKTNRILAAVLTVIMVLAALFLGLRGKPVNRDGSLYITDKAGVVSDSAEIRFAALQKELNPRLSVAIVRSTGKMSTAQYCETLWNNWALGTSDMLLLMVTGEQDYYFGYDTSSLFAYTLDTHFDLLIQHYLEPDFAAGDYEAALFAFSDGIRTVLSGAYFDNGSLSGGLSYGTTSSGMSIVGLLVILAIIVIFVAIVAAGSVGKTSSRRTRTVYRTPTPPRSTTRSTISRPVTPPRTASRPMTSSIPRPRTTIRTSTTRTRSSGSFGGGSRPRSGGFGGGGRSGGFGGGGRSGGMGGRGRK